MKGGFTLIELVLVMVVLALLLTATLPRFLGVSERLQAEQAAFEFAQLLRYARERAITQGRQTTWVWDDQTRRAHLEAAGDADLPAAIEEGGARSRPLMPGATLDLATSSGGAVDCDCVHFFPNGTGDPVTLTVEIPQAAYAIDVDGATGQVLVSARTAAR